MVGDEADFLEVLEFMKRDFFPMVERDAEDEEEVGFMMQYVQPTVCRLIINRAFHRLVASFLAAITNHGSPFGITGDKAQAPVSTSGRSDMPACR